MYNRPKTRRRLSDRSIEIGAGLRKSASSLDAPSRAAYINGVPTNRAEECQHALQAKANPGRLSGFDRAVDRGSLAMQQPHRIR